MSEKHISDYALIGDGQTAGLVHESGAIEWLCFPRFDSEACFAALLGDTDNGCWHFDFGSEVISRERSYRKDSLILDTIVTCKSGKLRITDFMPMRGRAPDVVRMVECLEGEVELRSELYLRFDYGRIHPLVRTVSNDRCLAISGANAVSLDFDDFITFEDRRFSTCSTLSRGETRNFVLTWYPGHEDPPDRVTPSHALADTEAFWSDWLSNMTYDGPYRDQVVRSLVTLKAMIHLPTGGIVAAPTASLPERIGGSRNWDYRYCWLRDATFTLLALIRVGLTDDARKWIEWLRRAVGGDPIDLKPFYTIDGEPRALEWEADWLDGFAGSRPVRFGNGAQGQLQIDIIGETIDCLYQAHEHDLVEDDSNQLLKLLAAKLEDVWDQPDAGIWESRGGPRHNTYSKVMSWVGFDRAAAWLEEDEPELSSHYRDLAKKVHQQVLEKGYDSDREAFVSAYGDTSLDASALRIPLVGFLPADDKRMLGTVKAIERELCVDNLVRRYVPDDTDDGVGGGEGAFIAATLWLADVYYLQGRKDDARELFEQVMDRANDLGLLAEELDLERPVQLGNFPQALSHLSVIQIADRLSGGRGSDRSAARGGG